MLAHGQKNWYYLVAKAAIECKIRTADRRITPNPMLFAKPVWGPEQKKETNV